MRSWTPTILITLSLSANAVTSLAALTRRSPLAAEQHPPTPEAASVAASAKLDRIRPTPDRRRDAAACPAQHDAAAYVCCDGEGGFAVCRGRSGSDQLLLGCIDQHEEDHVAWFVEHLPEACAAKPRGACQFEMTPRQFQELECSGYLKEFRCLNQNRGLATGRQRRLSDLLWRQRQLLTEAEHRFACVTRDW